MIRIFFSCLFLIAGQLAYGQISQPARWEQELKFSDETYSIVSMREEGLALIRDLEDFESGKKKWEVLQLDTALRQAWSTILHVEADYNFLGFEHTPNRLNLMFRKQDMEFLKSIVFDIDLISREIKRSETEVKLQIRLTHYTVADGNSVYGGYVNLEPVIVVYDVSKNKNIIVPGFFLTETELLDVRPNKNNTFNVLLAQRIQGRKKLIFRTFDKYGSILVEDEIPLDDGKTILAGASSVLEHDEVLIAGAYAFGNNRQASGIFSCLIDPFREQPVNYTEFPQLRHFLDYLSDKKATKIRQKTTEREGYGRNPEYKTSVTVHRIEEFAGGFALFGESYSSSSTNSTNSSAPFNNPTARVPAANYPYSPYSSRFYNNPYLYQPTTVVADVRMLQAFVVGYDFKGRRIWDYTIPMNDLKSYTRDQVSDFAVASGIPHFLFKEENELKFSNHATDTAQTAEAKAIPIRLNNAYEESRPADDEEGLVRKWYNKHFYVWGVVNVRDKRPSVPNRRVFFINKVSLD
jgi:hypothetical protein